MERAEKNSISSNKSQVFRAYNDYKNLYVRAIINNDDKLCKTCLIGLVRTGKLLHIDVKAYEKELKKRTKKETKKPIIKKSSSKKVKYSNSSKNRLNSIGWKDSQHLLLQFSRPVRKNEINSFFLNYEKNKKYKKVYDIHAVLSKKVASLKHSSVKKIRLAQFNQNTIRLVFENDSKIKQQYKVDGNKIIIKMSSKNRVSKRVPLIRKRSRKIIVIDPGHGGKDSGAVGYRKYKEKVVVLQVSKKLREILIKRGYKVYMTRSRDKFIKLADRTKFANIKKADLFLSIHANSVPKRNRNKVQGIETYFLSTTRTKRAENALQKENVDISEMEKGGMQAALHLMSREKIFASNKLAIDLQQNMLASLKTNYKSVKDGGVRSGPFWVLVGAQMPAALIEIGFISHPKEANKMVNSRYQLKQAIGIANGIDRYFAKNL